MAWRSTWNCFHLNPSEGSARFQLSSVRFQLSRLSKDRPHCSQFALWSSYHKKIISAPCFHVRTTFEPLFPMLMSKSHKSYSVVLPLFFSLWMIDWWMSADTSMKLFRLPSQSDDVRGIFSVHASLLQNDIPGTSFTFFPPSLKRHIFFPISVMHAIKKKQFAIICGIRAESFPRR